MLSDSYLLDYVQKDDKILLYGGGANGQKIYRFLKEQSQCEFVGLVDQNAEQIQGFDIPVYRPKQLKAIPPETYSKIIITVLSQRPGIEIYRIIRAAGVSEEKIIAPYTYLGPVSTLSSEEFIGSSQLVWQDIEAFIEKKYGSLWYFEPLIKQLKSRKEERDALLPVLKHNLDVLSPLESVVYLYILYLSDLFDSELMESLLKETLKIDQEDLRDFLHGVFVDTTLMCHYHNGYLFPGFYRLRRILLEKLCGMFDLHIQTDAIRKIGADKRRICITVPMLWGKNECITQIVARFSGILAGLGNEVTVMPLETYRWTFAAPPVFRTINPVFEYICESSKTREKEHRELFDSCVSIEYTEIFDLRDQLQSQLDKLVQLAPDLVIDMSDDLSILSYLYSQCFTTLCWPLRGYQSSSFFTYFKTSDKAIFLRENNIYHAVDEKQVVEIPSCRISLPKPRTVYNREMFQLNKEDFVLVTVGARLAAELTKDFIDTVCEKLLTKESIKWIVVGSRSEYLWETYADYRNNHRVIFIPYEDDLSALYQICDVFLNPPRMGGATSIRWAMAAGLPCALLSAPCDALHDVGLENTAGDTIEDMMEYILRLWESPDFYRSERVKFRNRMLDIERRQTEGIGKFFSKDIWRWE